MCFKFCPGQKPGFLFYICSMIAQALIISMIVLFIHATTWDGHIFAWVKKVIKPEGKIYKPVYGCPICMTPWWGSLVFFLFIGGPFREWFLTIGCAAGFSVLNVLLIDIKDLIKDAANKIR